MLAGEHLLESVILEQGDSLSTKMFAKLFKSMRLSATMSVTSCHKVCHSTFTVTFRGVPCCYLLPVQLTICSSWIWCKFLVSFGSFNQHKDLHKA